MNWRREIKRAGRNHIKGKIDEYLQEASQILVDCFIKY
jgi:hypothetical protein